MKREFSAGGIVYKLPDTLWLVVQHGQHKGWVFPKGLIGDTLQKQKAKSKKQKEETREEAAVREVKEEGGIEAKIVAEIKPAVTYWYVFEGEKIFKSVYFYLMEYLSGDIKNHDREVSDAKWLREKKVREILTYNNDKKAFEAALKIFSKVSP